jgi:flagellar FliJ protein
MKRFQFNLQRLLEFRQLQEDQAQAEFAKATRALVLENERLQRMRDVLEESMSCLRQEQEKSTSLTMLKMFQEYIDRTREEIRRQIVRVAKAGEHRQMCLRAYEEASRRRKVVENLREKRWQQYLDENLQEEQKFLDELAAQSRLNNR